jgi:hypothetical protein
VRRQSRRYESGGSAAALQISYACFMNRQSFRAAALTLTFLLATTCLAQAPAATKDDRVRELLVLMRAGDMGVQMVDGMIASLKDALPGAPDDFWTTFRQKVKASDLIDLLVPVYAKNLELADIEELIRFYRSPTGQRFLDKQSVILQESMAVGQKWGEQLGAQAVREMQAAKPQ